MVYEGGPVPQQSLEGETREVLIPAGVASVLEIPAPLGFRAGNTELTPGVHSRPSLGRWP